MSPAALVVYTFQALEAWAREMGLPREPFETPVEFATRLSAEFPPLGPGIRHLAETYARIAYARNLTVAVQYPLLEQLWSLLSEEKLRQTAQVASATGA
jgi:hypothetical protein